jgi:hypothetical protein
MERKAKRLNKWQKKLHDDRVARRKQEELKDLIAKESSNLEEETTTK